MRNFLGQIWIYNRLSANQSHCTNSKTTLFSCRISWRLVWLAATPPHPASVGFLSIFAYAHKEDTATRFALGLAAHTFSRCGIWIVSRSRCRAGIFANFFRRAINCCLFAFACVCSARLIQCELPHAHAPTPGDICIRQTIFYLPTNSVVLLQNLDALSHHKLLRMCRVCCSLPHCWACVSRIRAYNQRFYRWCVAAWCMHDNGNCLMLRSPWLGLCVAWWWEFPQFIAALSIDNITMMMVDGNAFYIHNTKPFRATVPATVVWSSLT